MFLLADVSGAADELESRCLIASLCGLSKKTERRPPEDEDDAASCLGLNESVCVGGFSSVGNESDHSDPSCSRRRWTSLMPSSLTRRKLCASKSRRAAGVDQRLFEQVLSGAFRSLLKCWMASADDSVSASLCGRHEPNAPLPAELASVV